MPALAVGATYVGTVVGAGFASGQEVWQFFGAHGRAGLAALALSTLLFCLYGLAVLELGLRVRARSHLEVVRAVGGPWVARPVDSIITFFLFGALSVMAAGAGAVFHEQFGLAPFWGAAFLVVAAVVTVLVGFRGVVTAVSAVVPLMLVGVVGISAAAVARAWGAPLALPSRAVVPAVPSWPLSALVYVSYNLVMAVAVLGPLGALAGDRRTLGNGALLGAAGLGVGGLAVYLAMTVNLPWAAFCEVPMVYVAGSLAPEFRLIYAAILLAEVYTTAVANLYGFAARVTCPHGRYFRLLVLASGGAALAASRLGFSRLVRVVYPLVGYAGLVFLVALTWTFLRRHRRHN